MWASVRRFEGEKLCLFESLTLVICVERSTPRSMRRPGGTPKTCLADAPKGPPQIYYEKVGMLTWRVAQPTGGNFQVEIRCLYARFQSVHCHSFRISCCASRSCAR